MLAWLTGSVARQKRTGEPELPEKKMFMWLGKAAFALEKNSQCCAVHV